MFIYTWLVPWQNEPHIIPGSAHLVVHLPPVFSLRWGRGSLIAKKKHQLFKFLNHKSKEPSLVTTDHSAVYTYDTYDILTIVHPHHSHSPLLWSISTFPQEERLVLDWASRPFRKVVLDPRISAGPDLNWGYGIILEIETWDLVTNKGLKRQSNPGFIKPQHLVINIQGTANMILFDMPLSCMSK